MKMPLRLLTKLLVAQFYKLNAGFFLFIFLVMFGVVGVVDGSGLFQYHLSLIKAILTSWITLAVVCLGWYMYAVKCKNFVVKVVYKTENIFLNCLLALPLKLLLPLLFVVQVLLYLPVLIYTVAIAIIGFYQGKLWPVVIIACFHFLICILCALRYYKAVKQPWAKREPSLIQLPFHIRKQGSSFLLWYTFYQRWLSFTFIKIFSLFALAVQPVINRAYFNFGDFALLFQASVAVHALLAFYYVQFIEKEMIFLRNLPVKIVERWWLYLFTYAIVLLPELLFLLHYMKGFLPAPDIFYLYLNMIGQLALFTAIQYRRGLTLKTYTAYVCVISIVALLMMPLRIFLWMGVTEIFIGFIILRSRYYSFETDYSGR